MLVTMKSRAQKPNGEGRAAGLLGISWNLPVQSAGLTGLADARD
jgi:hypothetical protein